MRLGLISVALLWLALIASTWAEAAHAEEHATGAAAAVDAPQFPRSDRAPASGSRSGATRSLSSEDSADSEYNFNWLDPDKKIYVLQNRKYTKANKLLLSFMIGTSFSNPYRTTMNFDPRIAFYFSEDWGIEGFYTVMSNSSNNTYRALVATNTSVLPVIRENKSQMGGLLHWAPWYSKINVFNQILYFDWYFSGGAGVISSQFFTNPTDPPVFTNQDLTAFYLGTGQQFHVSKELVVRWDVTGSFYNATYIPASTTTNTAEEKAWFSNYNFGIGLGLRL